MMNSKFRNYGLLSIRFVLGLIFLATGVAKLFGVESMVESFVIIGIGQWFRYVTGVIEVVSAVLLFVPGKQVIAAVLIVCTMIGAVVAHVWILGPSAIPALVLGLLALVILVAYRDQLPWSRHDGIPDS